MVDVTIDIASSFPKKVQPNNRADLLTTIILRKGRVYCTLGGSLGLAGFSVRLKQQQGKPQRTRRRLDASRSASAACGSFSLSSLCCRSSSGDSSCLPYFCSPAWSLSLSLSLSHSTCSPAALISFSSCLRSWSASASVASSTSCKRSQQPVQEDIPRMHRHSTKSGEHGQQAADLRLPKQRSHDSAQRHIKAECYERRRGSMRMHSLPAHDPLVQH